MNFFSRDSFYSIQKISEMEVKVIVGDIMVSQGKKITKFNCLFKNSSRSTLNIDLKMNYYFFTSLIFKFVAVIILGFPNFTLHYQKVRKLFFENNFLWHDLFERMKTAWGKKFEPSREIIRMFTYPNCFLLVSFCCKWFFLFFPKSCFQGS